MDLPEREGDGLHREEEPAVRPDELGRSHGVEGRLRRSFIRAELESAAGIHAEQHRRWYREHQHRGQPGRRREERQQLRVLGAPRAWDRGDRREDRDPGRDLDDLDPADGLAQSSPPAGG